MGILDLELWEKYKKGLPESVMEGPTSAFDAVVAPKDSVGRKLFLRTLDTLDAASGEPAGSREGLERRGVWDHTVGVAGDTAAIAQGKMMPIQKEPIVGEPGTYEKIMSPIADISSILHGRGLPSRKAAIQRDELELEEAELEAAKQKRDLSELDSFLKMNRDAVTQSRDLPPEQQRESLLALSSMLEREYGPGSGALLEQEAHFAGSMPDDTRQLFEVSPAAKAAYFSGGRSALQDFLKDQGNMDGITAGLDAQALGPVTQLYSEVIEPHLLKFEPALMRRVNEDGLTDMGEFGEMLNKVPETMIPLEVRPELMAWAERNADKVGFLDSEKITGEYQKKRAEFAARREAGMTPAQKEARVEARKRDDPTVKEKRRASEIRLKIADGQEITSDEQAFLDEVAKTDPFTVLRRSLVQGGSPDDKRDSLREEMEADPGAEGWHEVEPEGEQEEALAAKGLLIVERGEGDERERAAYYGKEE